MHAELADAWREGGERSRRIRRKRDKGRERQHCIKPLRAVPRSLKANAIATIRVSAEAVKEL